MLRKAGLYVLGLFSVAPLLLCAQTHPFVFEHFGSEQGLPQNSVYAICQDKQGFLWLGTADGLCRYDGNEIKVFKNIPSDTTSLSGNFIRKLLPDPDGNIWVGTETGLCCYFPNKEKFRRVNVPGTGSDPVFPYRRLESGEVFLAAANQKCFVFDPKSWSLKEEKAYNGSAILQNASIYSAFAVAGKLVFSRGDSISIYDFKDKKIRSAIITDSSFRKVTGAAIISDSIWAGTYNGIIVMNTRDLKYRQIKEINGIGKNQAIGIVNAIALSPKGEVLIGSDKNGLFVLDRKTGNGMRYCNSVSDPHSLGYNTIKSIFYDLSGNLWIGTDAKGAGKVAVNRRFHVYNNTPGKPDFLSSGFVKCFSMDQDGFLYVGTDKGLTLIHPGRTVAQRFSTDQGLPGNFVHCLLTDARNNTWTGTEKGLALFDREKKKFTTIYTGNSDEHVIHSLIEISPGKVLMATRGEMMLLDVSTRQVESAGLSTPFRNFTQLTGDGKMIYALQPAPYFGSERKAVVREKNSLAHFLFFANSRHCYADGKGTIWIASPDGLKKCDEEGDLIKKYDEKNGLPNSNLYGVMPDRTGHLWISTNKGISRFDIQRETFTNYDLSDGLQSSEFNSGAFYVSKDGEFFFGGVNGFNAFYPDSVPDNQVIPQPLITSCKIFEKEWKGDTAVSFMSSLSLPYNENTLSFTFSIPEFTNPGKNFISCRLAGLDTNWIFLGNQRKVSFIGLPAGDYVLQVKACNNDGIWGNSPRELRIAIIPPFWMRSWFITLCILILIVAFAFTIRYLSTRKLKRQLEILERQRLLEQERSRISRDMHDEIGSGLSKISLLCEITGQKEDVGSESRKQMKNISESSRQIVNNMSEIIWSIDPRHDTLDELLSYIRSYAHEYFEHSPVKLAFHLSGSENSEGIPVSNKFRRNIFLVFKEALNNVIKHSQASELTIAIECGAKNFSMAISDNGTGLKENGSRKYGNGLRNMRARIDELNGKIDIVSDGIQGTRISILCNNAVPGPEINTTLM